MTSEEDVNRLVNEAANALGGLNFVINLASDYPSATLDDMSAATWDRAMGNAKGSYLLCASAARIMRHNGLPTNGHLIMFSDWAAGATPYTGLPAVSHRKGSRGIHDQGVCGGVGAASHPG